MVCQYGEWLRPSGGRARPSSRQGLEDLRKSKEGIETVKLHNECDVLETVTVAGAEGGLENSTEHVRHKEGILEIVGNVSDWDGINAKKEGNKDIDRIYAASNLKDDTYSILNSSGGNQTDELQLKEKEYEEGGQVDYEVEGINLDKLNSFRPWPTWKRLVRMVCGLDDTFNFNLPSLGK